MALNLKVDFDLGTSYVLVGKTDGTIEMYSKNGTFIFNKPSDDICTTKEEFMDAVASLRETL